MLRLLRQRSHGVHRRSIVVAGGVRQGGGAGAGGATARGRDVRVAWGAAARGVAGVRARGGVAVVVVC